LGRMAGQMVKAAPKAITITYRGAAADLNTKPITATVLAAFLGATHSSVNMVNARQVAAQADIAITEAVQDTLSNYQTLLDVQITTADDTLRLSGTLFSNRPRLVRIDDVSMEAELSSHMILTRSIDAPGHIGRLGQALGDAGINIATFHLGRDEKGGEAITLVASDNAIPSDIQKAVGKLKGITSVHALDFN
jgi:D-3-phosphoglycerate dehydrogenase / 2-oxoglutarate reductase